MTHILGHGLLVVGEFCLCLVSEHWCWYGIMLVGHSVILTTLLLRRGAMRGRVAQVGGTASGGLEA